MDNEAKLDNERLENEAKLEYYINKSKMKPVSQKVTEDLKYLL